MNTDDPAAVVYLRERGIPHRLFQHDAPIESLEHAAQVRGQQPEQVVRSIVFRLGEDSFVMVLMPGPAQVPWKALRRHLGMSRLTMASESELLQATGYQPGTVTPFGLPHPMPVIVDEAVLSQKEISLGSGVRGLAIIMQPKDMLAALGQHEVVRFSSASAG
jgi:Cys-tRNA(Pro) deacylase